MVFRPFLLIAASNFVKKRTGTEDAGVLNRGSSSGTMSLKSFVRCGSGIESFRRCTSCGSSVERAESNEKDIQN